MTTIRVLVAEDSLTIRKRLVEVLSADPELEVVGEAGDGQRAFELCQHLRPDVVTLDMMMPVMSGLAATEHIMAYVPTPILIVSASVNRGEAFRTFDALAAGAVDVLDKPLGDEPAGVWERRLVSTVKLISRIKVITHLRGRLHRKDPEVRLTERSVSLSRKNGYALIVIGASTGGPSAILDILRALPPDFPIPILFVLHIGEPFGISFAEWLDGHSPIRVVHAVDGEPLPKRGEPRVIMAPPERHLTVSRGRMRLTTDPERHSCRPSVDVLFESVAAELGSRAIACLLTGMGRDGAEGLLALREEGSLTIVQDEASCTVFGMPREAILLGAADHVLPLARIAPTLLQLCGTVP